MKFNKKYLVFYIIVITIILAGDQISKSIVDSTIAIKGSIEIINNFFYFTYTHNYGGAWNFLEGHMWLFYIVTIVALVAMFIYFKKTKEHEALTRFGLVLVCAGTLGNFVDRLRLGYVRDFIQFQFGSYEFPIFNIADIAITVGIGLVLLEILMEEYEIWKISKSM